MLIRSFYILIILLGTVSVPPGFCDKNHLDKNYLNTAIKRDPFSLTPELQKYLEARNPEMKQKDHGLPEIRLAGVMTGKDRIMAVVEIENGETMSLKSGMKVSLSYADDQKISFWVKKITRKEIIVIFENGIETKCRLETLPQSEGGIKPACRQIQAIESMAKGDFCAFKEG